VEEGLSWHALERLRRTLDVPLAELSRVLRIAPRTLARRKREGRLQPDESDRLLRLSRVTGLALRLFEGDLEAARIWLKTPHRALGDQVPLRFAATGVGAREVENLLGRLEHGVVT
jgi:putative toxin-antitoxin system antitoxin component (TIGR02293 family)